jgi:hypothetical protein
VITGWSIGLLGMLGRSRLSEDRVPFDWRRILGAATIAGVLFAVGASAVLPTVAELALDAGLLACYPALLLVTGLVSRHDASGATNLIRLRAARLAGRQPSRVQLAGDEHAVIEMLLRRRVALAEVARTMRLSELATQRFLVASIRRWVGSHEPPRPSDDVLGAYILMEGAFADREAVAREIFANGVDPLEADVLHQAAGAIRRLPGRRWRAAAPAGSVPWSPDRTGVACTHRADDSSPPTRSARPPPA